MSAAQALPSGQDWSHGADGQMMVPPDVWSACTALAHVHDYNRAPCGHTWALSLPALLTRRPCCPCPAAAGAVLG